MSQSILHRAPGTASVETSSKSNRRRRRSLIGVIITSAATVLLLVYILVAPSERLIVGFAVVMFLIGLMLLEIPIFVTMIIASMAGMMALSGARPLWATLRDVVFSSLGSWTLSVIPMFILMGATFSKTGLMEGVYDTARKWFGRARGGLAVANIYAAAGIHAACGSTIAMTYAIGRVAIPEMLRSGYKPSLALGSVAMAGTLGQVLPPSILMVIYAGVAGTPVGPQLIAGIVPGLLLAVLFTIVIFGWGLLRKDVAPRGQRYSWRERLVSLRGLVPIVLLVALVLGGIFSGTFTVTESGAFGAIVAVAMGTIVLVYRARKARATGAPVTTRAVLGKFYSSSFMETISAVATVFGLIIGVNLLTRVMALSGLAQWVADGVIDLGLSKIGFLLLLIPIYLILGFFLDTLAMMLLTIPVFLGPLIALDVNLIWFGVFLIVLAEIDLVAPPLGILNFVVLGIGRSVTKGTGHRVDLLQVFRGVTPFIGACIVFLVLLIVFPDIATWLPNLSNAQ